MSSIGTPCVRKLWLEKNHPEYKEPLTASNLLKFLYGDLIEELVIFLVDVSGHKVEGRQDEQTLSGIKGHRDVVIDGTLTDVKSASSFSFQKFKDGLTKVTDMFGYLGQLGSYHKTGQDDPIVVNKKEAAFLAMDKQHGHLVLDVHEFDHENIDWEKAYEERIAAVNGDKIPDRFYDTKDDGYKNPKTKQFMPNGNKLLGTECSYCHMKFKCHDNIRVFLASTGPKYFTEIVKEPRMLEITKDQVQEVEDS